MGIREDKMQPPCQKCGMKRIFRDDIGWMCPNCNVQAEEQSGLVSTVQDPGESMYQKVVKKDKNGNEYVDYVIKDLPVEQPSQPSPQAQVPLKPVLPGPARGASAPPASLGSPLQATVDLKKMFQAWPVADISEFKKLAKVRKEIEKLQVLILDLTGDGNNNG